MVCSLLLDGQCVQSTGEWWLGEHKFHQTNIQFRHFCRNAQRQTSIVTVTRIFLEEKYCYYDNSGESLYNQDMPSKLIKILKGNWMSPKNNIPTQNYSENN